MNRFKGLYPRLALIAAGVALGLIARQVFTPSKDNSRAPFSINRPITEGLELDGAEQGIIPLVIPIDPIEAAESEV